MIYRTIKTKYFGTTFQQLPKSILDKIEESSESKISNGGKNIQNIGGKDKDSNIRENLGLDIIIYVVNM
jgi:hypothetical protein